MQKDSATRFRSDETQLEQCHSYINTQIQLKKNGGPGARENPPTRALEKPTRHKSWMTLLYPPGEGGRVVHFSVVGSLVGTA
jgi:hypothetical protein